MATPESPKRPVRRRGERRWRVPPALPREPDDPQPEALALLDEHPGPAGLLLWQLVRDVILWANTSPERRRGLFTPAAPRLLYDQLAEMMAPRDLEWAVQHLISMVANPEAADPEAVSTAAKFVSRWADAGGYGLTALWFAQAAVLASPIRAQFVADAGHLARRLGRQFQGEAWFRRAVALARRSGEWFAYAEALLGLGDTFRDRGLVDQARRYYVKVCHDSRRHGLRTEYRNGRIRLMRLALAAGEYAEALKLCHPILRSWSPNDPEYIPFAIDYAEVKLRLGDTEAAVADLRRLILEPRAPAERARIAALLALAAAMRDDRRTVITAWDATERALAEMPADRAAASILLELARAATRMNFHRQAAETAARVMAIAISVGDEALAAAAQTFGEPHHGE